MAIYLLHVEFVDDDDNPKAFLARLAESCRLINLRLGQVSKDPPEILYNTKDGRVLGLGFETDRSPQMVIRHLDAPGASMDWQRSDEPDEQPDTAAFRIYDKVWIMELGTKYAHRRFNRPAAWLDRRGMSPE